MADQFKDFAKKMPKGGPPGIGGGAVVAIAGLAGAAYALQNAMYTGKFLRDASGDTKQSLHSFNEFSISR